MFNTEELKKIFEQSSELRQLFDNGILESINKQKQVFDSIKPPFEEVASILDQVKGINFAWDNGLSKIVQRQQQWTKTLNDMAKPAVMTLGKFNEIGNMFNQEISLINKSVPLELPQLVKSMTSSQEYILSIQDSMGDIISELKDSDLMIPSDARFDFNKVNWSKLDLQLQEVKDSKEVVFPSKLEVKEATKEVLEENGAFQSCKVMEERLNILIDEVEKCKQPWYKAVFISIIATFVIFLIGPILEPLQKEYTNFIQQNGKTIIKQMQIKVQDEFGYSLFLSEYKIISTNEMKVRITNKKNSSSTGKLYFGQLVKVVEARRKWTLIQYEDESGEIIEGWVFSRYLSDITY